MCTMFLDCMDHFACTPLGLLIHAQINAEGGNHIIGKDGEMGRRGGKGREGKGREERRGEAVRAAHLYRQLEREEREKERDEQDKMRTAAASASAAAMDESTLGWEKADERTTPRKTDKA